MSETELCACGCGQVPPIAQRNDSRRGHVKGERLRYVPGHNLHPVPPGTTSAPSVAVSASGPLSQADRIERLLGQVTSLLDSKLASGSVTAATAGRLLGQLQQELERLRSSREGEEKRVTELWDVLRESTAGERGRSGRTTGAVRCWRRKGHDARSCSTSPGGGRG